MSLPGAVLLDVHETVLSATSTLISETSLVSRVSVTSCGHRTTKPTAAMYLAGAESVGLQAVRIDRTAQEDAATHSVVVSLAELGPTWTAP